jgi:hypothetical protein
VPTGLSAGQTRGGFGFACGFCGAGFAFSCCGLIPMVPPSLLGFGLGVGVTQLLPSHLVPGGQAHAFAFLS